MRKRIEPRYIRPETVSIGDTIAVHYTPNQGVTRTDIGTVFSRTYGGTDRILFTREGAELLRWNPAHRAPKIVLLDRATETAPTLEGIDV